ncbi:MAG: response regulator [Candidatus Hermodarchaeota archaeon]
MSKRILVVDDDYDTRNLAQKILELKGFEILAATDEKQALQILEQMEIHLILLDVLMPHIDGFKLFHTIRQELNLKIPILFFTTITPLQDQQKKDKTGVDGYITKPVSAEDLIQQVMKFLS